MEYETMYNDKKYKYIDNGGFVTIYVNDERWGSPQGDRFFKALLHDIEKLEEVIEDRTGDVVHLHEENEKLKQKYNELMERVEVIQDVVGFKL